MGWRQKRKTGGRVSQRPPALRGYPILLPAGACAVTGPVLESDLIPRLVTDQGEGHGAVAASVTEPGLVPGLIAVAVGPAVGEVILRGWGFPAFFAATVGAALAAGAAGTLRRPLGPSEIEEAAMMDGHSRIGAMMKMTLPLSWPDMRAMPRDLSMTLIDVQTNTRTSMRTASTYMIQGMRR